MNPQLRRFIKSITPPIILDGMRRLRGDQRQPALYAPEPVVLTGDLADVPVAGNKKVIVLLGAESTGTRLFARVLSSHPLIVGTEAHTHLDVLDPVWMAFEQGDIDAAREAFPAIGDAHAVLTRRSLPHAPEPGKIAPYMTFPDLDRFQAVCSPRFDLVLLITARSPAPNLASWTLNRASASGSLAKAKAQYQAGYRAVFDFINRTDTPYLILPFEALMLDGETFVQSIFQLLGLPPHPVVLTLKSDVNTKHYPWVAALDREEALFYRDD